jgi:hypothetical protein
LTKATDIQLETCPTQFLNLLILSSYQGIYKKSYIDLRKKGERGGEEKKNLSIKNSYGFDKVRL